MNLIRSPRTKVIHIRGCDRIGDAIDAVRVMGGERTYVTIGDPDPEELSRLLREWRARG